MENQEHNDSLGMTLSFDDDYDLFILTYVNEGKSIFQVKMTPQTFEKLTADMIRVIKNYNLHKLEEYQNRKEKTDERRTGNGRPVGMGIHGVDDGETKVERLEGPPYNPRQFTKAMHKELLKSFKEHGYVRAYSHQ